MKKTLLHLLIFLLSAAGYSNAQTTDWLWAKSACDLSFATNISSITTDTSGNIFIAGNFRDSARFGNTVYHPVGTSNMFVAKYDSSGNFIWMLPGTGNNVSPYNLVTDLCTDSSGNCYFTGFFNGNIIMSHDTITSTNSMPDVFVGKITSNGTVQWLQQGSGPSTDYSYGIGLDASGNCYIGGSFDQSISFGNLSLTANNATYDVFILKLDANGNFLSAQSAGGGAIDLMTSLAVEENGNCFITGTFTSPELVIGPDTLYYTGTGADAYVAKYDSAGNPLWARMGYGPGNQEPSSIAADQNGNCYVTGVFKADTMYLDTFTLVTYGYTDLFTAKYDSSGNLAWADHQGSPAFGTETSLGITADTSGNFYTTGLFRNPATFDTIQVSSISAADIFAAKFNTAGNAEWVEQSGSGVGALTATAIHSDGKGNIFITGSYEASTVIGYDSLLVSPGFTAGYYFAKIGAIDTTTTSIQHSALHAPALILYPVPASSWLYIRSTVPIESISVYDIIGNRIDGLSAEMNMVDVRSLSPGVYVLEMKSGNSVVRRNFIRQ